MIIERIPDIMKLSPTEQAELYGELGDLLAREDAWHKLSSEVVDELDREMEEYRNDPSSGRSWDQVKAKIAAGEWRKWQK